MSSAADAPATVELALTQTERLLRSDPAQALALAAAILKTSPHHPVATLYLGMAQRGFGAADLAVQTLRTLSAAQPHWAVAHCELGLTLSEMGQHAAAEGALRRAVELQPDSPDAWRTLGDALTAAVVTAPAHGCAGAGRLV